jgi:hypothetical protein
VVKITVKQSDIEKALEVLEDYTEHGGFIISKEPDDNGIFAELNLEEAEIPFMLEFTSDTATTYSVFMPDEGCVSYDAESEGEAKEDYDRIQKLFAVYCN